MTTIRSARKKPSGEGAVVAQRTLKRKDGKTFRLKVHEPVREPWTPEEWACRVSVRIGRDPERVLLTGRGVDSFQALLIAVGALRKTLAEEADGLVWLGEPGAIGLPVVVLEDDSAFLRIIECHVETEYARRAFNLKRMRSMLARKAKK